jgi:MFS family permease
MLATVLGLCLGHAMLYSVQASLIPELFGTRLRCTGASIGYQLAVPLSGGIAPLIATWIIEVYKDEYLPLAGYIIINSVISLGCVIALAETSRKNIET